jgi:hypothetical protein
VARVGVRGGEAPHPPWPSSWTGSVARAPAQGEHAGVSAWPRRC